MSERDKVLADERVRCQGCGEWFTIDEFRRHRDCMAPPAKRA